MLVGQFEWDVANMSHPWMYWTVLPIMLYLIFFIVKWYLLLIPVTLPLSIISRWTPVKVKVKDTKL